MLELYYPIIYQCVILLIFIVCIPIVAKKKHEIVGCILFLVFIVAFYIFLDVDIVRDINEQDTHVIVAEFTQIRSSAPYGRTYVFDDTLELYRTVIYNNDNFPYGKTYYVEYYKYSKIIKSMKLIE